VGSPDDPCFRQMIQTEDNLPHTIRVIVKGQRKLCTSKL